jgi:hypothetical protein
MQAIATTQHTHQVVFGRREAGCPRCTELTLGMPARRWAGYSSRERAAQAAARTAEIRSHDCARSRCGPVCTAKDY